MKELKPKKLAKGKPKCVNALEHANRIISSNEINHSQKGQKGQANNNHFQEINTLRIH